MTTSLYRHFADDGRLLYVGISLSWPARTKAHSATSRWFDQVARVEIEQFETRDDALNAEREAIIRERPEFNIVHNRRLYPTQSTSRGCQKARKVNHRAFTVPELSESACRFMTKADRKKALSKPDPLLKVIKGPDAIVGPALIYSGENIGIIVCHGVSGRPAEMTEILLGRLVPDIDISWAASCASVLAIKGANDLTMAEAQQLRADIIQRLSKHLQVVDVFDSDLGLARANARRFPSQKAHAILSDILKDTRGVRA